jgi:redox-sensing transcriptional repressor
MTRTYNGEDAGVTSGRLAAYLAVFAMRRREGEPVTSKVVGMMCGVNDTQVRRDLSALGRKGKRGVGYDCDAMIREIRKALEGRGVRGAGPVLIAGGQIADEADAAAVVEGELGRDEAAVMLAHAISEGEFAARRIEYLLDRATS